MKVLLLTDLLVYGLLLISSYFLVFRRSPRLAPARVVGGEVKRDPIGEVAHPAPAVELTSERGAAGPGHLLPSLPSVYPDPAIPRPWWASGVAVETSP